MPTPGENIVVAGRFRLNRKLGQGGMGSVWHATQLGLDAPCAIKFIEGEFAALFEKRFGIACRRLGLNRGREQTGLDTSRFRAPARANDARQRSLF